MPAVPAVPRRPRCPGDRGRRLPPDAPHPLGTPRGHGSNARGFCPDPTTAQHAAAVALGPSSWPGARSGGAAPRTGGRSRTHATGFGIRCSSLWRTRSAFRPGTHRARNRAGSSTGLPCRAREAAPPRALPEDPQGCLRERPCTRDRSREPVLGRRVQEHARLPRGPHHHRAGAAPRSPPSGPPGPPSTAPAWAASVTQLDVGRRVERDVLPADRLVQRRPLRPADARRVALRPPACGSPSCRRAGPVPSLRRSAPREPLHAPPARAARCSRRRGPRCGPRCR